MELNEFISDTLLEIAQGVENAQLRAKDIMAINPGSLDGETIFERSYIDFDVSIVVSENDDTSKTRSGKVGGKIKIAPFVEASAEVGGSGERGTSRTTARTHRVTFKVPVHMNANYKNNAATAERAREILGGDSND